MYAGGSLGSSFARRPGWLFWCDFPLLWPWHTHVVSGWQGASTFALQDLFYFNQIIIHIKPTKPTKSNLIEKLISSCMLLVLLLLFVWTVPSLPSCARSSQGDGNIRYYEISSEKPYVHFLTEYRSHLPQKGMGEFCVQQRSLTRAGCCEQTSVVFSAPVFTPCANKHRPYLNRKGDIISI